MPLSRYNAAFGGKKGSAAKAKRRMLQQYGAKKGEQVFYATKNKRLSQQRGRGAKGDREQLFEAFKRGKHRRKRG